MGSTILPTCEPQEPFSYLGNLNRIPELFLWEKNTGGNFTWVNEKFSRIFGGGKDPQDLIGRNDSYLFEDHSSLRYQEQDSDTIFLNKPIKILETIQSKKMDKKILCVTTKVPKYNNQNLPVGTIGCAIDITYPLSIFAQFLLAEKRGSKYIGSTLQNSEKKFENIKLTSRESECLALYLRARSSKEISRILKLSPKTVDYYIAKAKAKLNACSKSDIFDKAIEYGFINLMPDIIFKKEISIILK